MTQELFVSQKTGAVIVDGIRIGRLANRCGHSMTFYVPAGEGYSQSLAALNGHQLSMDDLRALSDMLKTDRHSH